MQDKLALNKYKTYGKRRSLRLQGWDYAIPCIYHVTLATYKRAMIFDDAKRVGAFVDALRERTARTHYTIYAFCVMPDHIHLLCQPDVENPTSLIGFAQHLKRSTTRRLRLCGVDMRIWQRGFYDHILRKEEDVIVVIDYILNNPVRAGIVADPAAYPYSFALEVKDYAGPKNVVNVPTWKPAD